MPEIALMTYDIASTSKGRRRQQRQQNGSYEIGIFFYNGDCFFWVGGGLPTDWEQVDVCPF